jgi:hypothetical protein
VDVLCGTLYPEQKKGKLPLLRALVVRLLYLTAMIVHEVEMPESRNRSLSITIDSLSSPCIGSTVISDNPRIDQDKGVADDQKAVTILTQPKPADPTFVIPPVPANMAELFGPFLAQGVQKRPWLANELVRLREEELASQGA